MATYKTPGVYVEEISTLPPSVAEVSTAVPAFFGYTASGSGVARIDTLLDFEESFGGAPAGAFTATVDDDGGVSLAATDASAPAYGLYYALSHYFKNGGGSCYVVSVGDHTTAPNASHFSDGLALLEKEDEPTLIVLTDAILLDAADYHSLCQEALAQCNKLGDRFCIFDVQDGDVDAFRNGIGTNYLKYGAAYHPYVQTTLTYDYAEGDISVEQSVWQMSFGTNGVTVRFDGADDAAPQVKIVQGVAGDPLTFELAGQLLTIRNVDALTGADVAAGFSDWATAGNDAGGFEVIADGDGSGDVPHTSNANVDLDRFSNALAELESSETTLYNSVKSALSAHRVTLAPSAAVAGVYASVDRDRGVWRKAPANVSLASVIGPIEKITHDEQESLNVDATGGKSINAIRAFTGKGTLVWGARTLAGNDNEWRYVSVRRLFNMIEESTRKASEFAVFEPNDMTTWLKVKGMIEGYLYGLWEQGALAGSTPDAAYFVNVGLGKTMTSQDVLEGRMNVEIGVAAVRPAEFIILRFSHKLQEA